MKKKRSRTRDDISEETKQKRIEILQFRIAYCLKNKYNASRQEVADAMDVQLYAVCYHEEKFLLKNKYITKIKGKINTMPRGTSVTELGKSLAEIKKYEKIPLFIRKSLKIRKKISWGELV